MGLQGLHRIQFLKGIIAYRFGVDVDIDPAAWIAENIGICAEVSYEWIDELTVHNVGVSAEIDYSSLIVCAGLVVTF